MLSSDSESIQRKSTMKIRMTVFVSLLLIGCISNDSVAAKAVNPELIDFLEGLKKDVRSENWTAVSKKIKFPIKVFRGRGYLTVRDAEEMKKKIELVFNENIIEIIDRQTPTEFIRNMRAFGFWSGTIWVEKYAGVYLIKGINNNIKRLRDPRNGIESEVINKAPNEP